MTALPTEMEDERVAAVASDAPSPMQEDAAADMMDVMDASHSERPLKRFQWDPSDLELEAAALAIALPDVEPAVRRPRERPERAARRRLDKAGRRREYKKRKDPLALVRDYLPRVRRRPRFEDAVRLDWQGDEDKKVLREAQLEIEAQTTQCRCVECKVVERLRDTHKYVCIDLRCTEKPTYDDLLELLEHQMTKHGRISLGCTRVVEALGRKMPYHFRRTTLPPPSVYVFSQYLNPAVRPVLWTDKACVHRERQRLYKGLKHIFSLLARRYVVNAFETAAMKVEGRGEVELASQYETALEFYNSALVHLPGDAHTVDDGSFAVGPGRNWLLSADPENAQFLNQFTYHWGDQTENGDEGEIVLFSAEKASSNVVTQDQPEGDAPSAEDEEVLFSIEKVSGSADTAQPDTATRLRGDQVLPFDAENANSEAADAQPDDNAPRNEDEGVLFSVGIASSDAAETHSNDGASSS